MQTRHIAHTGPLNYNIQKILAPIQPFIRIQRQQKTGLYSTMPIKHKELTISYFSTMLTSKIYFNQYSMFLNFIVKQEWHNRSHYRYYILESQDNTPTTNRSTIPQYHHLYYHTTINVTLFTNCQYIKCNNSKSIRQTFIDNKHIQRLPVQTKYMFAFIDPPRPEKHRTRRFSAFW